MAVPGRRPENVFVAIIASLGHYRMTLSSRLHSMMFQASMVGMWLHKVKIGQTGSCLISIKVSCIKNNQEKLFTKHKTSRYMEKCDREESQRMLCRETVPYKFSRFFL